MANRHVHRRLAVGMSGPDVVQLQYGINRKARAWDLPGFHVVTDGVLGEKTKAAARDLLHAMGVVGRPMQRARTGDFSVYAQRLLRGTRPRTPLMLVWSQKRRPQIRQWRRRQKGLDLSLQERAMREAERLIGVMEKGGNNVGPEVERIIASGGGVAGQPWCGWFCAHCYKTAGSKLVTWQWGAVRLLYPLMGIKRVANPQRGDLTRFKFDHVGMFDKWIKVKIELEDVEGNTGSSGAVSDSTTGGDGVYRKRRAASLVNDYLRVTR